jgi:hypothetical protein
MVQLPSSRMNGKGSTIIPAVCRAGSSELLGGSVFRGPAARFENLEWYVGSTPAW